MVYHGPSTGCNTCKQRRVKCGKERPACQNCVKRGKICPGYAGVFDHVHRDQTMIVMQKSQQKRSHTSQASSVVSSSPSRESSIDNVSTLVPAKPIVNAVDSNFRLYQRSWVALPLAISNDYRLSCIDFFFTNYTTMSDGAGGFMQHLLPVIAKAPLSSPVHDAIGAVAVTIANLWSMRGCDTPLARRSYVDAVGSLRRSLQNPEVNEADDILMAAILLDFFDSLSAQFSNSLIRSGSHKRGALALIQQRGRANFKSKTTKDMLVASRNGMVYHAIFNRQPLPTESLLWYRHPELPRDARSTVSELGVDLANFVAEMQVVFDAYPSKKCNPEAERLLSAALLIERKYLDWYEIVPEDFQPVILIGDDIAPSIREAGVYQDRCAVYKNLPILEAWNSWRFGRTILLRSIRKCYLAGSEDVRQRYPGLLARVERNAQQIADHLCESIPSYLGDQTTSLVPSEWKDITFPSTKNSNATTSEMMHNQRQAARAGGWFARIPFLTLLEHMGYETDMDKLPLRQGQMDWIWAQVRRLQRVWTFSVIVLDPYPVP